MKKLHILSFLMLFTLGAFAQGAIITLNVTVVDVNNTPVPNQPVLFVDSSATGTWYGFITNSVGVISATVTIPPAALGSVKHLFLSTSDNCNNHYFKDTLLTANMTSLNWTETFVICSQSASSNCNHTITHNSTGPLTYTFSSTYAGGPNSGYLWSFGDGTTGTGATPTHTYSATGAYYYCLTVDSCTQICDSLYISPNAPCDASVSLSASGLTVLAFPTALGTPGTFYFNWGDGTIDTISSLALPIVPYNHTYAAPGTYAFCLTHADSTCSDTFCTNIGLALQFSCNASFIIDTVNSQPGVVYLWNNSLVTLTNPATSTVSYNWTFGDGFGSNQQFPTHAYTSPGSYEVCLTIFATDSFMTCTSQYCDSLTVDQNGNIIYKGALLGWTLVVLDPNSIGIGENELEEAKIYPNPAADYIEVGLPSSVAEVELSILSINGTLLHYEKTEGGQHHKIDVRTLPGGFYVLRIASARALKQLKFVKL